MHTMYAALGTATTMAPGMVQPVGSNLPHQNTQPYLGLNYCIALQGHFPSWN
jgi:microcystin-dependent protein